VRIPIKYKNIKKLHIEQAFRVKTLDWKNIFHFKFSWYTLDIKKHLLLDA